MASQKNKKIIYKHAELAANPLLDLVSSFEGLSVFINMPVPEHELFKTHFRSDFITIFLISKGEATFGLNLKEYSIGKNGFLVSAPNAIKQLISVKKATLLNGISFTADFLGKMGMPKNTTDLLDYITTQFNPHWKLNNKDAVLLLGLMRELKRRSDTCEVHPFGKELLYHTFNIVLYEISALSKKYTKQISTHLSRKENLVMNFTNLVQQQFTSQRNVQQYANQLNITAKYLTETVKEISGKNAGEIIDDFVLLEAKLLLDNPALSIGEIADTLYFSNQSFFGKYFKRFTGLSPKEYRNAM